MCVFRHGRQISLCLFSTFLSSSSSRMSSAGHPFLTQGNVCRWEVVGALWCQSWRFVGGKPRDGRCGYCRGCIHRVLMSERYVSLCMCSCDSSIRNVVIVLVRSSPQTVFSLKLSVLYLSAVKCFRLDGRLMVSVGSFFNSSKTISRRCRCCVIV